MRKSFKILIFVFMLSILLVTVGCSKKLKSITVTGDEKTFVGKSIKLEAVLDPEGIEATVTWESSDENIATVDETGRVTGVAPGTVTITAKSGEVSGTKSVEVSDAPSITIKGNNIIKTGSSVQLTASVYPDELKDETVTWTSENTVVATVDNNGLVQGVSQGSAVITAKVLDTKAEIIITVMDELQDFSITYNLNGGTNSLDNKASYNAASIPLVLAPATRDGYIFDGWYEDEECSGEQVVQFDVTPNRDLVLYAKWVVETYKITYDVGNGEEADGNPTEYDITQLPIALNAPTRNGFKFIGWQVGYEATETTLVIPAGTTGDIVMVANWEPLKSGEFNITYDFNGGVSEELLVANATSEPKLNLTNYNYNHGTFWGGTYAGDIHIGDHEHDPGATFSDRIYIARSQYTGLYEVISVLNSGGSSWPSNAEYVITVSSSYGSYGAVSGDIKKIHVGQTLAFSVPIKEITNENPATVYFYDEMPNASILTIVSTKNDDLVSPGRLGFDFLGWFDDKGNKWENLKNITDDVKLTAEWNELTPVTDISVDDICEELKTGDTYDIKAHVEPRDAFFQSISYETSNRNVLTVSSDGTITAVNAGTAIISMVDYMKKTTVTREVTVYPKDTVDIHFDEDYTGVLKVGETVQITAKPFGKGRDNAALTYQSNNNTIATVTSDGLVTAASEGTTYITVTIQGTDISVQVYVVVANLAENSTAEKVLAMLVNNNFARLEAGNISLYDDGTYKVYVPTYGSVNRYLFDEFMVDESYYNSTEQNPNNHQDRGPEQQIEFVTVHDTATLTGSVTGIASNMSAYPNQTSIHYTVGNDSIYGVVPEKYIAYHAGDGTGTYFQWVKTDAVATSNEAPTITVVQSGNDFFLAVNGTQTTVSVPKINGRIPTTADLTILGPVWKVEGGYYYVGGPLWSSYNQVGSRGGNNNSIGIEMCSNLSGDIYDTFQRTAQLVADILLRNNLDTTRVKMHNTWSGKNCPQTIIAGGYWYEFMKMVNLQYAIQKDYKNVNISIEPLNDDIIDSTGRVIALPEVTTTVSYKLTVEANGETKEITLYNIVPGTTTWEQWDGEYLTSDIWNNGKFSI